MVRAPAAGEKGLLAGINVPGLLSLLRGKTYVNPSGTVASVSGTVSAAIPSGGGQTLNVEGSHCSNVSAQQMTEATMQATRHARRLYVGNLPSDTTEAQIGDFFNRALVASKGSESGDEPVISVYINLDKRFAFIETRTMREAVAGLYLDGVKFFSVFLRVRRPNDFVPHSVVSVGPPEGFNPAVLGIVSTQVSDGPNKMFIGGIPYSLTEDQVKGLLQSYGELAAFNLIKEPATGTSKGFAFFEYTDSSVVDAACEGLHGMQVGDKTLTVRRATQSAGSSALHGSVPVRPNGNTTSSLAKASDLLQASTRVIELRDIVSEEGLNDDETLLGVRQDIEQEVERFGKVEEVYIPIPSEDSPIVAGVGSAFVKFAVLEDAESAQICLNGRKFEDRAVTAEFFDESRFNSRENLPCLNNESSS